MQGCRGAGQQEHGGGHGARCGCGTTGRPPRVVPERGCGARCAAQSVPAHRPHRMVSIAAQAMVRLREHHHWPISISVRIGPNHISDWLSRLKGMVKAS